MSGRSARANSARGRAHRPNVSALYRVKKDPVTPGEFEFTLEANAGNGWFSIDEVVENFTWEDTDAVLTGQLAMRRPDPDRPAVPVQNGYRVRCRTRWGGRVYEVWQMRALPEDVDPFSGRIDVPLTDDLIAARRGRGNYRFRTTKTRKYGWFAHEIARAVCKREGLPIGTLTKGTKRIKKLVKESASALDVIKAAYAEEAKETGKKFVIRWRNGKLDVVAYERNSMLYVFKDELESISLAYTQRQRPVTSIEAKGRVGKGNKAKKLKIDVMDRSIVRRFGFLQEEKDYGRVASATDLKARAMRDLAKKIRKTRSAEVEVAGIPFIRRGDGMRWINTEPGWHGPSLGSRDRTYVYVTSISHSVSAGRYTMRLSWSQVDPFQKDKERLAKETRAKKKAKRAKK